MVFLVTGVGKKLAEAGGVLGDRIFICLVVFPRPRYGKASASVAGATRSQSRESSENTTLSPGATPPPYMAFRVAQG